MFQSPRDRKEKPLIEESVDGGDDVDDGDDDGVDVGDDGDDGDDVDGGDHDDYYVEAIESCFAAALSCVPRYEASQRFASLNLQIDQHGNKEDGRS